MRSLTISETAKTLASVNTDAFKLGAQLEVGKVLNDRALKIVTPLLPTMAQYWAKANPEQAKPIVANLVAGALIKFAPTNEKAQMAAQVMIQSASIDLVGSFNISTMINDLLDGLDFTALTPAPVAE